VSCSWNPLSHVLTHQKFKLMSRWQQRWSWKRLTLTLVIPLPQI
jgi:hypothetical protein